MCRPSAAGTWGRGGVRIRFEQAYNSEFSLFNAPKYTLYQTSTGPRSNVRIERWIPGSKCPGLRNQFLTIYSRRPHLQIAHIKRVNRCWALVKVCFGSTKCTSVVIAKPFVAHLHQPAWRPYSTRTARRIEPARPVVRGGRAACRAAYVNSRGQRAVRGARREPQRHKRRMHCIGGLDWTYR